MGEKNWIKNEIGVRLSSHALKLLNKIASFRSQRPETCASEMFEVLVCDEALRLGITKPYSSKDDGYAKNYKKLTSP